MSKVKIALITVAFALLTFVIPIVLLLALINVNAYSVYYIVIGVAVFASFGFLFAMLLKVKSDISEQIEELKVQNAAIAYRLSEIKKQASKAQPAAEDSQEQKAEKEKKERFDEFN
jgi:uncharacterized YccA/Bax inhibitor family protein